MDILPLSAYPRAARSRKANVAKYRVQEAAEKQVQLTQPSRGRERKAVASSGQAWGLNSKAGELAPKTQDRSKLQKKEVDGSAPDRNTEPLPQAKGVKRKAEGQQEELQGAGNKRRTSNRVRKPSEKGAALTSWEADCGGEADEDCKPPATKPRPVRQPAQKRRTSGKQASGAVSGSRSFTECRKCLDGPPPSKMRRLLEVVDALSRDPAREDEEGSTPIPVHPTDTESAAVSGLMGLNPSATGCQESPSISTPAEEKNCELPPSNSSVDTEEHESNAGFPADCLAQDDQESSEDATVLDLDSVSKPKLQQQLEFIKLPASVPLFV